jgi:hypothetical protein
MRTEPILVSDCGPLLVLDDKDNYQIEIEPGNYQVVVMGFRSNKPAARFKHPNILATVKRIHEFKHYRKQGSKFWTAHAGIDHYLVIPRNKILLMPEKGYSYIKAEINGVKVSFNVSGGGGGVWTDYLGTVAHIAVNHTLSDLKKLAEVAERGTPFEKMEIKEIEAERLPEWHKLHTKADTKIKEAIYKMIEEGKNPAIQLDHGFTVKDGIAVSLDRRCKKIRIDDHHFSLEWIGAVKRVIGIFDYSRYNIRLHQINWYETAKINGLLT